MKDILGINIVFLLLTLVTGILVVIAKSIRWRIILRLLGIYEPLKEIIKLYWFGSFMGFVTPGNIGEMVKVYSLQGKDHNPWLSFCSIVIDRVIDILTLLALGLLVALFVFKELGVYISLLSVFFIALLLFSLLVIKNKSLIHNLIGKFIKKNFPSYFKNYNNFSKQIIYEEIKKHSKSTFATGFLFYIVGWLLFFLTRFFLAIALNVNIDFVSIAVLSTAIALVTILPITVAGLGTRDITCIYLFSQLGYAEETAVLFSVFVLFIDFLIVSLGGIPYIRGTNKSMQ